MTAIVVSGDAVKSCSTQAWNNFVMQSLPASYERGSNMRAAAISCLYMNFANNGGINYFLTYSYDYDVGEVIDSIAAVGAHIAARQLRQVVEELGTQLLRSSEGVRGEVLDRHWTEDLNQHDVLSSESDADLMAALKSHVAENENFYASLSVKQ